MKENKEIQSDYKARMIEKGYVRIELYVPMDKKKLIRDIAQGMRDKYEEIRNQGV